MTTNQLKYWELQETKKHNRKTEEQQDTKLSNDYTLGQLNLAETKRSNQAREQETNRSNLAREVETNRSNLAQESLKAEQNSIARIESQTHQFQAAEQARSNRAQEAISYANLAETYRSNTAKETAQSFQNYTNRKEQNVHENQLAINQQEADIKQQTLYEQNRANLTRENETYRHDYAMEQETHRNNLANNAIGVINANVNQQNAYTNLFKSAQLQYPFKINIQGGKLYGVQ